MNVASLEPFDARALVRLGRVNAVAASPCGAWAAVAVERLDDDGARYACDLWRVSLTDDAPPRQLTLGDSRDRSPRFRPDGALGFLSDRPIPGATAADPGDKRTQVWLLPAGCGEPRPLTDEPLGVADFRFASAGDRLVVLADALPSVPLDEQRAVAADRKKHGPSALYYRAMPVRFWDHWIADAEPHLVAFDGEGRGRRDLTPAPEGALRDTTWDLDPSGQVVAASWGVMNKVDRILDRSLRLIPCDGGAPTTLGAEAGAVHTSPLFSPDGARLAVGYYLRTPVRYGPKTLRSYDLAATPAAARDLTADWDRWPTPWCWTRDGAAVIVTADDHGHHPAFAVDADTGAVTRLGPRDAGGVHSDLVPLPDGARLLGIRHTLLEPPEPCTLDLAAHAPPRILARLSGWPAGAGAAIATVRDVRAAIGDGRTIQAFIVEPAAVQGGETEAFLWIHGGPVSAWSDGWHWRWNPLALVAQGYTVILPNPAGSTGFGGDWIDDVWGNVWGARCYEDLVGLVDVLEYDHEIAPGNTVVMGGSFGGYMTNWIGGNTSRFRLLVSHASVFSMSGLYGATDMPSWWLLMMGDTPYRDPVGFDRYAPSRRVSHWTTPTLITHGDKDYRVPIGESLAMFEALDYHGVLAELVVFPDENHWILKPRNVVAWYEAVLDFVARHWDRAI